MQYKQKKQNKIINEAQMIRKMNAGSESLKKR